MSRVTCNKYFACMGRQLMSCSLQMKVCYQACKLSQYDNIMSSSKSPATVNQVTWLVHQFRRTLNGSPCPGMITSAMFSASCRLTSCTTMFILRSRQLSSSEQLSNKSPTTSTVPAEVPFTCTLTSCPVWPGLGTTDTCGREETV